VEGRRCLDAGASAGGFTDVLLRRGARQVVAVDVGYGQLAWRLRTDPRVVIHDRTNVRELTPQLVGGAVDVIVADLSFISLTLVLPALPHVPPEITAGTGTVGVRLSPHPVARALVTALGRAITAPSANREGETPPTTASGVLAGLGDAVDFLLDGGATTGGPPSTVVDVTTDPPRVLRDGAVRPCV